MMKKYLKLITVLCMLMTFSMSLVVHAENVSSPYYTYTEDAEGNLIRSTEGYTPGKQITSVDGVRLRRPQHVFVDEEDYIYITDSQHRKVFVLNGQYDTVAILEHKEFSFPRSSFVTKDFIYVVDFRKQTINLFDRKALLEKGEVKLLQVIGQPDSPIFDEGYKFEPVHVAVDLRGNIYVQSDTSPNGLIMLDSDGNFMTFFGGNPVRMPLIDRIRSFFLTEKQQKSLERIFIDIPSDIAIDRKGYIYTVTSTLPSNPIKKFNVSGRNYLQRDMIGTTGMQSVWVTRHQTILAVSNQGYIYEYDANGHLLFLFGGRDITSNRIGLLNNPISIASNAQDEIFVVDQKLGIVQVYQPTQFASIVHEAIDQYQLGNYQESHDLWQTILEYNEMFDYAHVGLGDSYMLDDHYEDAYREYAYANDYEGISDAFWGIRQAWLRKNITKIIISLIVIVILRIVYLILNRQYEIRKRISEQLDNIRKNHKIIDELIYVFNFLRHPFNGLYEIKWENKVSMTSSTIIYILLAISYIFYFKVSNPIFVPKVGVNVGYNLLIMAGVLLLWVASNYLVCAINDGEGSIKQVYNATAYSLSPVIILLPIIAIISNGLTYQESVIYNFGWIFLLLWILFMMFFMIKDIHNYEVKETVSVIFKSLFTMLIIGLFLFIVFGVFNQLTNTIQEIVTEVVNR